MHCGRKALARSNTKLTLHSNKQELVVPSSFHCAPSLTTPSVSWTVSGHHYRLRTPERLLLVPGWPARAGSWNSARISLLEPIPGTQTVHVAAS